MTVMAIGDQQWQPHGDAARRIRREYLGHTLEIDLVTYRYWVRLDGVLMAYGEAESMRQAMAESMESAS